MLASSIGACKATIEDSNAPHVLAYDAGKVDTTSFTGALPINDDEIAKIDPSTLLADSPPCSKPMLAKVYATADGDTIDVNEVEGSAGVRVRLIGVDSPEIEHDGNKADCYGNEAATFTKQLIGHFVWLTFGDTCKDKYDRTLAYVHLSAATNGLYQRQLLRRGFAKAFIFDDNDGQRDLFTSDESIASREKQGLWSSCVK